MFSISEKTSSDCSCVSHLSPATVAAQLVSNVLRRHSDRQSPSASPHARRPRRDSTDTEDSDDSEKEEEQQVPAVIKVLTSERDLGLCWPSSGPLEHTRQDRKWLAALALTLDHTHAFCSHCMPASLLWDCLYTSPPLPPLPPLPSLSPLQLRGDLTLMLPDVLTELVTVLSQIA